MKKILPFILFALVSISFVGAQSLSLSFSGGPLANNGSFLMNGDLTSVIASHLTVTNNSNTDISVRLKKVIKAGDTIAGSTNTFCWSLCWGANQYVDPDPVVIPAHTSNSTSFSGDYEALGHAGMSKIRYVLWNNTNTSDSVCVNIYYNAGTTGINEIASNQFTVSNLYPNPAISVVSLNYTLPESSYSDANVIIRNLLGSIVKEIQVTGSHGRLNISVNDLPDGIYYCTFLAGNQAIVSKKLVVKH